MEEWIGKLRAGQAQALPPPPTESLQELVQAQTLPMPPSENLKTLLFRAWNFCPLFEVYESVQPKPSHAIIKMRHRGFGLCSERGFEVWHRLTPERKRKSLRAVLRGLLGLCSAGLVSDDCRVENLFIDDHSTLTAVDLDGIVAVESFQPPDARKTRSLWYPSCRNPMLYAAWQAYVSVLVLLPCSDREQLNQCLQDMHSGVWLQDNFSNFQSNMEQDGWAKVEADANKVLEMVLLLADAMLSK